MSKLGQIIKRARCPNCGALLYTIALGKRKCYRCGEEY